MPQELMVHCEKHMAYLNDTSLRAHHGAFGKNTHREGPKGGRGLLMLLESKGLSKYFGGLAAVSLFDIHVKQGETVGLIGPNGAGKTTVFNLITGLFPPTRGTVLFDGKDITGKKPHLVAKLWNRPGFSARPSFC